jgi:hypothetical protein
MTSQWLKHSFWAAFIIFLWNCIFLLQYNSLSKVVRLKSSPFMVAIINWLTVTECLRRRWPRICSVCHTHNPVIISSFMTAYHLTFIIRQRRVPLMEQTNVFPLRAPEIIKYFCGVRVTKSLVFYVVFCGS